MERLAQLLMLLVPVAGRFSGGGGSDKRSGAGAEMKGAAQLAGGRVPAIFAPEIGIQAVKDLIVVYPSVHGYFIIIPDQSLPDIEFLDA